MDQTHWYKDAVFTEHGFQSIEGYTLFRHSCVNLSLSAFANVWADLSHPCILDQYSCSVLELD